MLAGPITHRRGRRTDLFAVLSILAASELPTPAPDRATLRRFRRLIADLGSDFYVALLDERLVGFIHVTYARQLADTAHARVEALAVVPEARGRGVGSSLAVLARRRAERRGCHDLSYSATASTLRAGAFLTRQGWRSDGEVFRLALGGGPEPHEG
jgi:GNAT superfamily N-acetyltransferase